MIISDIFFVLHCEPKGSIGKAPMDCCILQGKLRASKQNLDRAEGTEEIVKIM